MSHLTQNDIERIERMNDIMDDLPEPEAREQIAIQFGGGPACGLCGVPTQQTGSCFTCRSCGETTGCG